jgi:hypothetical protein
MGEQYSDSFSNKHLPDVPTLPAPGFNRWGKAEPPPKIDPDVASKCLPLQSKARLILPDQFRSFDKYSSASSNFSSQDNRSASPLTASTQYTSPDSYSRGKPSRTPSPPSPYSTPFGPGNGTFDPRPGDFLRKNSEPAVFERKNMAADGPFSAGPRQNTFPGPARQGPAPPQGRVSPFDQQWKFRNEKGREHFRMGRTPSPPVGPYANNLPPTPNSGKPKRLDSLSESREEHAGNSSFNRMPPTSNSPQRRNEIPPTSNSPQRRNEAYPQYQPRYPPMDDPDSVSPRGMPPRRPVDPYGSNKPPPKWQPDLYQQRNNNLQKNDGPLKALPRVLPDLETQTVDQFLPIVDPAVQIGLDDPIHERSQSNPEKEMYGNDNLRAAERAILQQDHRGFMSRSPQSSPEPRNPNDAKRRSYPPAAEPSAPKHACRGCAMSIAGRSLKDASGRLTGRYHRDCFRCTTCASPFPTGEFYVLADRPYCQRHYHERNGSCCRQCRAGIEGTYLETDAKVIYHPQCFRCDSCGSALAEEYWELEGKTLCHRHNFGSPSGGAGAAAGGPQKYPERRRTKLVNNGMGANMNRRPPFF